MSHSDFSPELFVGSLTVLCGIWVTVSAISYKEQSSPQFTLSEDASICILIVAFFFSLFAIFVFFSQYGYLPHRRASVGAIAITMMVFGFGAGLYLILFSTSLSILEGGCLFMSLVLAGGVLEANVGVVTGVLNDVGSYCG